MNFKRKMELLYRNVIIDISNEYASNDKTREDFIEEVNSGLASMLGFEMFKNYLKNGDKVLFTDDCTREKDLDQFLFQYYKVLTLIFDAIVIERIDKKRSGFTLIKGGK